MKRTVLVVVIMTLLIYYFYQDAKTVTQSFEPEEMSQQTHSNSKPNSQPVAKKRSQPVPAFHEPAPSLIVPTVSMNQQESFWQDMPKANTPHHIVMPYFIEDDVVVVQGDMVVGSPAHENAPEKGLVEVPVMKLWPTNQIPYLIDPGVINADRIKQALVLFENTSVQFVPYSGQDDAILFVEGTSICKSFVGHVGGHQRIWLAPKCSSSDVAHEIMHALGFVHEQNRTDRDVYIDVLAENIEEQHIDNFRKLPEIFMTATGLSNFDYESIMMYPSWMFSKNGQPTMQSKLKDYQIRPAYGISQSDIDRVNKAYLHQGEVK